MQVKADLRPGQRLNWLGSGAAEKGCKGRIKLFLTIWGRTITLQVYSTQSDLGPKSSCRIQEQENTTSGEADGHTAYF